MLELRLDVVGVEPILACMQDSSISYLVGVKHQKFDYIFLVLTDKA